MARYYEETALIEFVKQYTPHINGETTMQCVERAIRNASTADVVPKIELHDDHHKQVACYTLGCREGDKIKREVAREIFEELESIFDKKKYVPYPLDVLAELKKKYTEG